MIIFAAGMRRSGSTAIFNIVKELIEMADIGFALSVGQSKKSIISTYFSTRYPVVVKAHRFNDEYYNNKDKAIALMSVRDIREICCSIVRLGMCQPCDEKCLKLLDTYIEEQQSWSVINVQYFNKYENWVDDLTGEVKNIASFLDIPVEDEIAEQIATSWSMESCKMKSKYIAGTHHFNFLNPNHITSGRKDSWKEELTPEQADLLTNRYKWWLNEYDYPC